MELVRLHFFHVPEGLSLEADECGQAGCCGPGEELSDWGPGEDGPWSAP